jgi:transposase, IS5 family
LNEALPVNAANAKFLRTNRVRADTTVVGSGVAYPTGSGPPAQAVGQIARATKRIQSASGPTGTRVRDRRRAAGRGGTIPGKLKLRGAADRDEAQAVVQRITGELAIWPRQRRAKPPT